MRRSRRILAAALAASAVASAQPAEAGRCAPFDVVENRLAGDYGETRRAYGVAPNGMLVVIWASDDTGTWSVSVSGPDGVTCLLATGTGYVELDEAAELPGDPA